VDSGRKVAFADPASVWPDRIGRIAFKHQAVQDQIGRSAGQTDFVTVMGIAAVFDDNVGMRFKDRYHLVGGIDFFTAHHPTNGLIDNFFSQLDIMIDLQRHRYNAQISPWHGVDDINSPFGVTDDLAGGFDQIGIGRLALFFPLGIEMASIRRLATRLWL
jgi:hypothetical protein